MTISDFNKNKPIAVTSVTGTPTISRTLCFKITSGDDTTTGTGEIVLDWTNIYSQADIGVYDENDNLLDYYFESFDATAETAVIWVYKDWTRDGSVQAKIAYGSGPSDQSVSASTVFDKESNLVAGYLLNETSGDGSDVTSNNLDATNYGVTQDVTGIVGPAYSFDGTDDELFIDGTSKLNESNLETGFTLSIWMKTSTTSYRTDVMGRLYDGGNSSFGISLNRVAQNVSIYLDDGSTNWQDGLFQYDNDVWFKFDFLLTGSGQIICYANGSEVYNSSGNNSIASCPSDYFCIGSNDGNRFFNGLLDNAFVWEAALTLEEIIAKYDAEKITPDFFSQQKIVVYTNSPTNATASSATLNGTLNSLENNSSLDVYFEYGTDTFYGNTTATQTISSVPTSFDADISGLTTFATYHYRSVTTNGTNYWYGSDVSFYTADLQDIDETLSDFQEGTLTDVEIDNRNYLYLSNNKRFYDFEDGTQQGWTFEAANMQVKSNVARGSYSIGIEQTDAPQNIAYIDPFDGNESKIDLFEFYWYENAASNGGGIRLMDANGDNVCAFASNQPQWEFDDGTGYRDEIYAGGGSDRWIYVKFENFDWVNGTYDYYIKDLVSDHIEQGTRNLEVSTGIKRIYIQNYSNGWSVNDIYMWFDNIYIEGRYKPSGNRLSPQFDLSSLGIVDDTLIEWTETLNNQTITIETRVSLDGGSTWTAWATAINGNAIPSLSNGNDVSNGLLECRQTLETTDSTVTPELHSLNILLAKTSNIELNIPIVKTENLFSISLIPASVILTLPSIDSQSTFEITAIEMGYPNIICNVLPLNINTVLGININNKFRILNT